MLRCHRLRLSAELVEISKRDAPTSTTQLYVLSSHYIKNHEKYVTVNARCKNNSSGGVSGACSSPVSHLQCTVLRLREMKHHYRAADADNAV